MRLVRWLPPLVLLAASFGSACGDDAPGAGGALGEGAFQYRCVDDSDAACASAGVATTFPKLVAVGAELGLSFTEDGETKPSGAVFPASTSLLEPSSRGFVARRAGSVGILAREATGSTVLDFTTLTLRDPAGLRFTDPAVAASAGAGSEPLALTLGEERTIEVHVVDTDGNPLAGALAFTWTAEEPDVVAIAKDERTNEVIVTAKKVGGASVLVRAPGIASTLTLPLVVSEGGS